MQIVCRGPLLFVLAVITLATASLGADLQAAKDNFDLFCVKCHGESGRGDGASAATLATKPRDLGDCDRMAKITDDLMFKVIKEGGQSQGLSSDMAAWGDGFEDEEIRDMVAYIRTFCGK